MTDSHTAISRSRPSVRMLAGAGMAAALAALGTSCSERSSSGPDTPEILKFRRGLQAPVGYRTRSTYTYESTTTTNNADGAGAESTESLLEVFVVTDVVDIKLAENGKVDRAKCTIVEFRRTEDGVVTRPLESGLELRRFRDALFATGWPSSFV